MTLFQFSEQKQALIQHKDLVVHSLDIYRLNKSLQKRLIRSAQANGWTMNEAEWVGNEGLKMLIEGALDLRAEMSSQGAILSRTLDQLITQWQNWLAP